MGDRFREPDLFALATHEHGEILIRSGKVEAGLALLDEAMVTVTGYALSPLVTGIVYCGTIAACRAVYEVQRAAEWTTALSEWCDRQPELLAFTGRCLLPRAEILQIRGSWQEALEQARQAATRFAETTDQSAAGYALYREGEVHRPQGDDAAAEDAYRRASQLGYEPQPSLALLRLAQGRGGAATAAIARAVAERTKPLDRAAVLPAQVEITLAEGQLDQADAACSDLESVAEQFDTTMLGAMAAHARGAVELARDRPGDAIVALRRAVHSWQELGAPYEGACARVLIALACRQLGDDDGVSLELAGALRPIPRRDPLRHRRPPRPRHPARPLVRREPRADGEDPARPKSATGCRWSGLTCATRVAHSFASGRNTWRQRACGASRRERSASVNVMSNTGATALTRTRAARLPA